MKRSGRQLSGLCPFHSEKTPSFFVNDEEGFFHCFGCGKKGSSIDYVMETRGLSFPEAVRFLAGRVGIDIPETDARESAQQREVAERRKRLRALVREAVTYYHETLMKDRSAGPAREYLKSRKITGETAREFLLGYCPDRDQLPALLGERLKDAKLFADDQEILRALREIGLISLRENGSAYDIFRSRLLFPISRSDGIPIAVGGRIMTHAANRPKYINSCESPIYSKRKTFYGFHQAMEEIRRGREAFLVEGYMDVLSMYQAGHRKTVAACGTAVTNDHVLLLKRFVDRLTVIFDGDAAGMKAAASCFEVFLNSGIDVQAVMLPEGEDPSSLVELGRTEELANCLVQKRGPVVDAFLEHLCRSAGEGADRSPAFFGRIAEKFAKILIKVANPVEREFLTRRAAERLGVSFESMSALATQSEGRASGHVVANDDAQEAPPPPEMAPPRGARRPIRTRPAVPSVVPIRSVRSAAGLNEYCRQLIVSVLCEPELARNILEMPSLVGRESVAASFPDAVRRLLSEIAESTGPGIDSLRSLYPEAGAEELESHAANLRALLEKFGFGEEGLLREAIRQRSVGGAQPKRVVQEANTITLRANLSQEVQRIRVEESEAQDEARRLELIQQKLLQRRSLKQLTQK